MCQSSLSEQFLSFDRVVFTSEAQHMIDQLSVCIGDDVFIPVGQLNNI